MGGEILHFVDDADQFVMAAHNSCCWPAKLRQRSDGGSRAAGAATRSMAGDVGVTGARRQLALDAAKLAAAA